MKKLLLLCVLYICLQAPLLAESIICKVSHVNAVNTFACENGSKIKIWGIKSAIKANKTGQLKEATEYLSLYIKGKDLTCDYKATINDYTVAQCYVKQGNGMVDVALYPLKKGYAEEVKAITGGSYESIIKIDRFMESLK